jgi:PleD family two-component response regulator
VSGLDSSSPAWVKHRIAPARFSCFSHRTRKDNQIAPACESASTPLQAQTSPPHRILVVDDDGDIRRLSTQVLIRYGYEVDAAEDGAAAGEALNTRIEC